MNAPWTVKRFVTFILLGPLLAWLIAFIYHVPDLIRRPDIGALTFIMMAIVFVFAMAFIPALLLALADGLMERWKLSRAVRAAACAVLAYPLTLVALWVFFKDIGLRSVTDGLPVTALIGMIPAAVC